MVCYADTAIAVLVISGMIRNFWSLRAYTYCHRATIHRQMSIWQKQDKDDRMPLTKKGKKIKAAMEKQYGKDRGDRVFYAAENKGTIKGVAKKGKRK